jgi:hypothetical protein
MTLASVGGPSVDTDELEACTMNTTTSNVSKGTEREGRVAKGIERQTAKLPSDILLWAAGASIIGSLAFQILSPVNKRRLFFGGPRALRYGLLSNFVGQWVPTILLLGVYNKIVKVAGAEKFERGGRYEY